MPGWRSAKHVQVPPQQRPDIPAVSSFIAVSRARKIRFITASSGLLISCAIEAASLPTTASFSACRKPASDLRCASSRYSCRTNEQSSPLVAHRQRTSQKQTKIPSPPRNGNIISNGSPEITQALYLDITSGSISGLCTATANPNLSSGPRSCRCTHTSDGCTKRRCRPDRPSMPVAESSPPETLNCSSRVSIS